MTDDPNLDPTGSAGPPSIRYRVPRERSLGERVFLGPDGVRAGWRALLFFALLWAVYALEYLILLRFAKFAYQGLLPQEIVLIVALLVAAKVMAFLERRKAGDYGTPWRKAFSLRFWQGVLWGAVQLSALMLLIAAWHGYSFGGIALHGKAILDYALRWALIFLAVGFAEESLFRGYLQFTLTEAMGFWPAALLLSFVFGAVHLQNPGEGVVGALSVFSIGIFLCLTLRRTGDLWLAIGWHAAFDFGETYFYSVPNSGLVMPGHLFAASLHGARWLTGGTVGPEGSAFSFAVLAVSIVAFNFVYRPRHNTAGHV